MWMVAPLVISDEERVELERRVRAHTTTQRMVRRCRVVLEAAGGLSNRRIAPVVGMNEHQVGLWRRRFEKERLAGLKDRKRSGRPRRYGHDERLRIVATATSTKPEFASHWSHVEPCPAGQRVVRHGYLGLAGASNPGRAGHQAPPGPLVAGPSGGPDVLGAGRRRMRAVPVASDESFGALGRREDGHSRPFPKAPDQAGRAWPARAAGVRVLPARHGLPHGGLERAHRRGDRDRRPPATTRLTSSNSWRRSIARCLGD